VVGEVQAECHLIASHALSRESRSMNEEVVLNPPEDDNFDEEVPEEEIQMPTLSLEKKQASFGRDSTNTRFSAF
jgi:hypothetical protein